MAAFSVQQAGQAARLFSWLVFFWRWKVTRTLKIYVPWTNKTKKTILIVTTTEEHKAQKQNAKQNKSL